jgi:lysozyme family protein
MSAVFEDVKAEIIEVEGSVYTNDPDDPGGETKYGISKRAYPDLDIFNLTESQALEIYERDYWIKYGLSQFKTQSVANKVMLAIINMGDYEAIMGLQRAICHCGLLVNVDGKIGRMTFTGANTAPQLWMLDILSIEYVNHYIDLVDRNEKLLKFLHGWIKRAMR